MQILIIKGRLASCLQTEVAQHIVSLGLNSLENGPSVSIGTETDSHTKAKVQALAG